MEAFLNFIKERIILIINFIIWITSLVVSYIAAPNVISREVSGGTLKWITSLVLIAIIVAIFLFLKEPKTRPARKKYFLWSVLLLIIGLVSFFNYTFFLETHTVRYPKGSENLFVIGNNYTQDVIEKHNKCKCLSLSNPANVLQDYAVAGYDDFTKIWPKSEMMYNGYRLTAQYVFTVGLLVSFLMLVSYATFSKT